MGDTLAVIRQRVRTQADVDTIDVSDAEIADAINNTYLEALADEPWPFLQARVEFPTVAGQSEYPVAGIASDLEVQRIRRVQTAGLDLERIEAEEYYTVAPLDYTSPTGSTKVRWWSTLEATILALWPPPGAVQQVRVIYTKLAPKLLDADPTLWPQRYDGVIEAGALVYVFQKIGDFDAAEVKKKEFADYMRAIRSDAQKPVASSPIFFGGAETLRQPLLPPCVMC